MAQRFSRLLLSGAGAGGKLISVAAIASPGTVLHTAVAGLGAMDIVTLFASNVTALPVTLTVEWGGSGNPNDHLVHQLTIPANSAVQIVAPGLTVQDGLVLAAFASTTGAINISGHVDRIA